MSDQPRSIPDWTARQVILATLFVVSVGLGFWLLYRYHIVVLVLFASIILGTAIRPLVDWLIRRGIPRGWSLSLTFLLLLGGIIGITLMVVPLVIEQSLELFVTLPEVYVDLRQYLLGSSSLLLQNIGYNLPPDPRMMMQPPPLESGPLDAVTRFTGFIGTLVNSAIMAIAVILLTSFWVLESERAFRSILLIIPLGKREQAREFFEQIESKVGAYVRGQLILCLSIGVMALIVYMILDLPNALAMALFAGILEVIPVFGPALGTIPAALVAFSIEPTLALWVLGAMVIIQGIENNLLVPRVMGAAVGVSPIVTLLSLATFTSLFGLPGALMAVPLAAVIQITWNRFIITSDQTTRATPSGRDINSALRYEIQELIGDVRKQLRKKDNRSDEETDQIEDAIEALAIDLDIYLDQDSQGVSG